MRSVLLGGICIVLLSCTLLANSPVINPPPLAPQEFNTPKVQVVTSYTPHRDRPNGPVTHYIFRYSVFAHRPDVCDLHIKARSSNQRITGDLITRPGWLDSDAQKGAHFFTGSSPTQRQRALPVYTPGSGAPSGDFYIKVPVGEYRYERFGTWIATNDGRGSFPRGGTTPRQPRSAKNGTTPSVPTGPVVGIGPIHPRDDITPVPVTTASWWDFYLGQPDDGNAVVSIGPGDEWEPPYGVGIDHKGDPLFAAMLSYSGFDGYVGTRDLPSTATVNYYEGNRLAYDTGRCGMKIRCSDDVEPGTVFFAKFVVDINGDGVLEHDAELASFAIKFVVE